jgi:hypothetical protein
VGVGRSKIALAANKPHRLKPVLLGSPGRAGFALDEYKEVAQEACEKFGLDVCYESLQDTKRKPK